MTDSPFDPSWLASVTGGVWTETPGGIGSVCTDSRAKQPGMMFLAIPGDRFDGHRFVEAARDNGAVAACVERRHLDMVAKCIPLLVVEDSIKAYQSIAAAHRSKYPDLKMAGVTGSVGKTSVKEMLHAIFVEACGGDEDRVLYTSGNTNNHIGVPSNLLRICSRHAYAVIEMGTSSPGEIKILTDMARPSVALVNSIAPCHLERLIDLEGVAREKGSIYSSLPKDGVAVMPSQCAGRSELVKAAGELRVMTFGSGTGSAVRCEYLGGDIFGSRFALDFSGGKRHELEWNLTGAHQASNAAAAACAALALGVDEGTIVNGLPRTVLPGMRMRTTRIGGVTYVNDAYNANPASMLASFELLARGMDTTRLVLILGEMRELGGNSRRLHSETAEAALRLLPCVKLVTIGDGYSGCRSDRHFDRSENVNLDGLLSEDVVVFAKGSRGSRVELALPESAR
ncbi:MAG: UDP-N-acetylmuramoyl-tripeptide--D-alanyl-D-alanine ligase [Victivallaceae bacterium]|nr:UDP-N-acetylmuramoyl-tripeptide--D-alanyl-D-alanine ligase [Victivallaceae bacterium]